MNINLTLPLMVPCFSICAAICILTTGILQQDCSQDRKQLDSLEKALQRPSHSILASQPFSLCSLVSAHGIKKGKKSASETNWRASVASEKYIGLEN